MAILYGTMQNGQLVAVEADSQGRLVAQLANPVDPSNFVAITGSTMTGNLTVPSLNSGPLAGLRNILLNGNLAINQRGVDIAAAATGSYGQDRWKKTAGGMTQIVEAGNFEPGATYTLSGTGVTTQQLTAPATGDWTIPDVPVTARKIQLELGPVATPFEHRPIGTELALCQRYYRTGSVRYWGDVTNNVNYVAQDTFPPMRSAPALTIGSALGQAGDLSGFNAPTVRDTTETSVAVNASATATATGRYWYSYTADAEL